LGAAWLQGRRSNLV